MENRTDTGKKRRSGGRSARVQVTVLQATMDELMENGLAGLSIGAVAARSGVHPTSIYRRWKTVEQLALEAALAAAEVHVRIPDTGSLRSDIRAFLTALDAHVRSPLGRTLLGVASLDNPLALRAREVFWRERFSKAKIMFERAATRGEIAVGTNLDLALEFAIAPIYLRALVLKHPPSNKAIAQQVDWILQALTIRQ